MKEPQQLPVLALLPDLVKQLETQAVVLQAPPGAGKSTALPLYLLQKMATQGRIILVQPRRLAAVSIANFLAQQLNQEVGQQIGYQVRQQRRAGPDTRLLVVTEGILTRMLQSDPELSGTDLVIFDEFHERNLHSDLGLALFLESRQLRPELGLLVMSATLPAQALASWLQQQNISCHVLQSEGRQFPVEISYQPPTAQQPWLQKAVQVTQQAIASDYQGILVFLPGQAEIRRLQQQLQGSADLQVFALHGGLSLQQQNQVITPLPEGQRKLVLSTNIAETSLTLPGIGLVIDCGRERQAQYIPKYRLTRLITRRIAQAAATQRAGRAGRTGPGACIRVWSEDDWHSMAEYRPADIEQQDLTELLLEVAVWGSRVEDMAWFTAPNSGHLQSAKDTLQQIDALDDQGQATALGKQLSELGSDLRGALTLLKCEQQQRHLLPLAALLVASIEEQEQRDFHDVHSALQAVAATPQRWPRTQRRWLYWCARLKIKAHIGKWQARDLAWLLLQMFPDRVAAKRASGKDYQLATGAGLIWERDSMTSADWLIVVQVTFNERRSDGIIRQFLPLHEDWAAALLGDLTSVHTLARWRSDKGGLEKVEQLRLGALVVSERALPGEISAEQRVQALLNETQTRGLQIFNWDEASAQLLRRLRIWADQQSELDVSDDWLLQNLDSWAAPFWLALRTRSELSQWRPHNALRQLLSYAEQQRLDRELPTHWHAPSGRQHKIIYQQDGAAVVALKLQEVFGTPQTPLLAQGQLALTFDLLSPAGRLLQRTRDLAAFWQNAYLEVKKEMRGRYPKHPWPEDPEQAQASHLTTRALKR
ncbi:ATP-dependent helicase HrpB [Aliidiomarina minuta]|uniref:ATP-dependent helicase HrpB n=1 Tax=Aliidiomarina minuta TaxID=880057 RepID=A0A432W4F6_9GAMM|nr:ATP-dependent helicase HrpB [Aliidiomarina minuta]RUO24287.1 ATP-dependent helicase HrpB [Aliidiomarina minuta]